MGQLYGDLVRNGVLELLEACPEKEIKEFLGEGYDLVHRYYLDYRMRDETFNQFLLRKYFEIRAGKDKIHIDPQWVKEYAS